MKLKKMCHGQKSSKTGAAQIRMILIKEDFEFSMLGLEEIVILSRNSLKKLFFIKPRLIRGKQGGFSQKIK